MEEVRQNPLWRGERAEARNLMFRKGASSNPAEDLPATVRFKLLAVPLAAEGGLKAGWQEGQAGRI